MPQKEVGARCWRGHVRRRRGRRTCCHLQDQDRTRRQNEGGDVLFHVGGLSRASAHCVCSVRGYVANTVSAVPNGEPTGR